MLLDVFFEICTGGTSAHDEQNMNDSPSERPWQTPHLTTLSEAARTPVRSSSQIIGKRPVTVSQQLSLDRSQRSTQEVLAGRLAKKQRLHALPGGLDDGSRQEEQPGKAAGGQVLSYAWPCNSLEEEKRHSGSETVATLHSPFPPRPGTNLHGKSYSARRNNKQPSGVVQPRPYTLCSPKTVSRYPSKGKFTRAPTLLDKYRAWLILASRAE